MNDDIKELLNDDGELIAVYKDGSTWTFDTLTRQVVDYITNLQEENKHLDKVNCHLRKKINNDIYKSRIDKAIEYVKSNEFIGKIRLSSENKQSINKLLNILQGNEQVSEQVSEQVGSDKE